MLFQNFSNPRLLSVICITGIIASITTLTFYVLSGYENQGMFIIGLSGFVSGSLGLWLVRQAKKNATDKGSSAQ